MTVIPHGRFLKIVETAGVARRRRRVRARPRRCPPRTATSRASTACKHVDANEVVERARQVQGEGRRHHRLRADATCSSSPTPGANIRRMMRIVEEIDVGGAGEQICIEPIHNASASEIATQLNELFDCRVGWRASRAAGGVGRQRRRSSPTIATTRSSSSPPRPTTSACSSSSSASTSRRRGEGEIHVLPLQHAQCDELHADAQPILGTGVGATAPRRAHRGRAPTRDGDQPVAARRPETQVFEGEVKVSCDKATNSLVTTSSLRDYAQLRNVIDKLDKPRRQVFIEAVIMDVNVDHSTDSGIGYHGGGTADLGSGGDSVFYGGNNPQQSISGRPGQPRGARARRPRPGICKARATSSAPACRSPRSAWCCTRSRTTATPTCSRRRTSSRPTTSTPRSRSARTSRCRPTSAASAAWRASRGGRPAARRGRRARRPRRRSGSASVRRRARTSAPRSKITPHINDSDQVRLEIERGDHGRRLAHRRARRGADQQAHRRHHAHRARPADGRHRRPGPRRRTVTGETKIPVLGDIPVLGVLFRQQTQAEAEDEPAAHPDAVHHPRAGRLRRDLRAQDAGAAGVPRPLLRLRRHAALGAAAGLPSRQRAASRTSGRRMLKIADRERLEAELEPDRPRVHEAVRPAAAAQHVRRTDQAACHGGASHGPHPATHPATPALRETGPARANPRTNRPNSAFPVACADRSATA